MTGFHILLLALIQGITEFLPISSSGHLALFPALTGMGDQGVAIDIAVHVGTLLAVLIYFRQDTLGLAAAAVGSIGVRPARRYAQRTGHIKLFWTLVFATMPVVMVGFVVATLELNDYLRTPHVIAAASIFFGVILYVADQRGAQIKSMPDFKLKAALQIGFAQIFSLIPGASRAGVTMTAARLAGFDRQSAARFSMLLSIPTILGAGVLTATKLSLAGASVQFWLDAALAAGLACVSAMVAIHLLLKWLERASMTVFVLYRVLLGVVIFASLGMGWI